MFNLFRAIAEQPNEASTIGCKVKLKSPSKTINPCAMEVKLSKVLSRKGSGP